jgi:hypothetical protein
MPNYLVLKCEEHDMACEFDSSDGDGIDYFENTSPTITGVPITLACWVKPKGISDHDACITVGSSSTNNLFALNLRGNAKATIEVRDGSSGSWSQSSGSYTAQTWQHVAGVCASNTSRKVYLDGVVGNHNTVSRVPSGVNLLRIGEWSAVWSRPLDGSVCECAIWNVELTADEIGSLASGYSADNIREENLVMYCPLVRDYQDVTGNNLVTPNNTVVYNSHAPVFDDAPNIYRAAWGGL